MSKSLNIYRHYSLDQIIQVNDDKINEIIISSHYEINHGAYMNDKIILEIVKQLDKKSFFANLQGKLSDKRKWKSFFWKPFFYQNKAYRLVWYLEDQRNCLWISNCFRRSKYENK